MKIFVIVTEPLIGISIVCRYTCVYNFKSYRINKEKEIYLPNEEYISCHR